MQRPGGSTAGEGEIDGQVGHSQASQPERGKGGTMPGSPVYDELAAVVDTRDFIWKRAGLK